MTARSAARPCWQYGGRQLSYAAPLVSFNTYGLKHVCPRFREALKAVHVVKGDNGWEVLRAGHRPVKFSDRQKALKAARKFAALQKVGVLVHESGRVIEAE